MLKEDQKNNQMESMSKRKSSTTDKLYYTNKLDYSKKLRRKQVLNIRKLLSTEKKIKANQIPFLDYPISKNNSLRLKELGHSYIYTTKREELIEKERLITQIFAIKDEINKKKDELEEYKDFYDHLKDNFFSFKIIIEKLLNIEPNDNDVEEESIQ